MRKLFVSQPMKGKSNEEIRAERRKAVQTVEEMLGDGVEVIESFFENAPHEAKPLWFLGESLKCLAEADIAYFVPGWESARGCMIEYMCAGAYGKVIYLGERE